MSEEYYSLPTGNVCALNQDTPFPPLDAALDEPNGLIAIGGNLSTNRLLDAYRHGIFPWFNENEPIMWWSPNPRMVLFPDTLKISHSLTKVIKKQKYEVRFNTAFYDVITACSQAKRPDQAGTWINTDMVDAYSELHKLGHAISSESWLNGELVGGCYGIKIGRMFYGESMFHTQSDASKVAFVHLINYLKEQHVGMIDCQMKTPLLTSFGGQEIPRATFEQKLSLLVKEGH